MEEKRKQASAADGELLAQSRDGLGKAPVLVSRRKLLATLGAAGAALMAEGMFSGRLGLTAYGKEAAAANTINGIDLGNYQVCIATTLTQLRTSALINPIFAYYVTDEGKQGFFRYDASDTASADNEGTVVVGLSGRRFKRVYGDTLYASWFGARGDGVTVETAALQKALDASAGKKLFIPKQSAGFYLTGQLFVRSDTVLEFEPGTVVQAIDTLSRKAPYERLIRLLDVTNVHIIGNGATLQMNKAVYSSGEQAHIFDISGSENVLIERIHANDSGGDGFYVGAYSSVQPSCKQITLRDCSANNNRRQGLSVTTVDGLLVDGCRFMNTTGTAPKSGVDIEPNNTTGLDVLKRIRFVNCVAEGNVGRGFLVNVQKLTAQSERVDITFEACRTKGNSFGYSVNYGGDGASGVKGDVRLIDCVAESEQYAGYSVLSSSPDSIKTTYIRCKAVNCNTVNAPDDLYGYGSSFIVTTVPQFPRIAIGNVEYHACESIDERPAPLIVRGFSVKKNANEQIRGITYVNCSARGGSPSLYAIDGTTEELVISHAWQPQLKVGVTGSVSLDSMGCRLGNSDASGDIVLTLPQARKGFTYSFIVEQPYQLQIAAAAGGWLLTPAGSRTAIQSATPGCSVTLLGRADGGWEITQVIGDWFAASETIAR
ncbi:right-handed parallel beta-helix repeat-containing protein [Paenibacillus sp. GCM10023250]|uniref:right-handed parallel beta-helix repeat-containing protein n=1 Tax=Paenibacillus sp. GCM10023250 TaxID=3252648 RepID=UPI00361D4231